MYLPASKNGMHDTLSRYLEYYSKRESKPEDNKSLPIKMILWPKNVGPYDLEYD
jgi:hypothetical protein